MARGVPKVVLEKLHAVPLLAGCNAKELRQIGNLGVRLNVADGTVLTKQGKPGREFFLLLNGAARCLVDGNVVANFGPGDFFGEMALLDHGPRHATVVAEGPIEVLILYGQEFHNLMGASPSITRKLLAALAERARANANPRS
ncbi:MAG: cyclic nucleotide-binding domain-containing protein [Acidimicrobiales bacterium]|jgi:CRP-like cAMP-binding protein